MLGLVIYVVVHPPSRMLGLVIYVIVVVAFSGLKAYPHKFT